MKTFLYSYIAGILVGMPIGVAGAIVADSALAHNKRNVIITILAVAAGDTFLAAIVGFFFKYLDNFVKNYESQLYLGGFVFLLIIAISLTVKAFLSDQLPDPNQKQKGALHYILTHYAPGVSAFMVSAFHPGSLIAMVWLATYVVTLLPENEFSGAIFAPGIGLGSLSIFLVSGTIFWIIRKKAGNFVRTLRFGLAGAVFLLSFYMLIKYYNQPQKELRRSYEHVTRLSSEVSDSQHTL